MDAHQQANLLLAILRQDWSAAERLVERQRPDRSFAEYCMRRDVHPQIHAILERAGRQELLGEALEPLQRMRAKVQADNLLLIARAEQCAAALHSAGVPALALKGLDLIHRVYDRFDERALDDVDLLVPYDKLNEAMAALETVGFRAPAEPARTHYIRSSHHLPLESPGPISVGFELHWDLAQQGRFSVDPDGILERAKPLDVGGKPMLRCDDHDLVAHLLLHHLSHYFDTRMKWLVDLQRITRLPGFDWTQVVARIEQWGARVATGASLLHLHKLDPTLIPQSVRDALPLPFSRRVLLAPLLSSHPLEMYRGTRRRRTQLFLAAILLERLTSLPGWMIHRRRREFEESDHPLDQK